MERVLKPGSMRKFVLQACLVLYALSFLVSCGGSGSTPVPQSSSIQVTISPQVSSLNVGTSQQFTASVTGTSNQGITWSVNTVDGGNSTVGTITPSGLYTAPANVPSPASVRITATSAADSAKSATLALTVNLKVTVTPPNLSVQVFHSQQFMATVAGVSNTAVQWSVNGIVGGNSTLGTIDSTGFYVAPIAVPSPATIQVEATSVADKTQGSVAQTLITPDTTAPQVVSVQPADLATNVGLQATIQVTFDSRMDPSSLPAGFSLLDGTISIPLTVGYDPGNSVVTLSPRALLAPSTTYQLAVADTVKDQSGNALNVPFSASFTTTASAIVPSTVVAPPGVDPTTMTVVSLQGPNGSPAADGTFAASVRPTGTSVVATMVPGESFGLLAVSIGNPSAPASLVRTSATMVGHTVVYRSRWQTTASPALLQVTQPLVLDFQTTAESLLFFSPALFDGDAARAEQIMTAIAAEPKTALVAQALQAAWNTPFPLRDPNFVSAYSAALRSIVNTLGATATPPLPAQPPLLSSGQSLLAPAAVQSAAAAPVYHSFDVCCINIGSLGLQGTNYVAPISVAGPSQQQFLGNAAGWLVNVVQLPAGFDPSTIVPGTDPKGNIDSPPPTQGENLDKVINTFWVPGDSLFQYTDLLGQLNNFLTGFLNSLAGFTSPDGTNISLPQPAPGTSISYLIRAYSGADSDPNEINLIARLPQGTNLWIRARLANYTTAIFDEVNALGVVPPGILNCLAQAAVQDQVTNTLVDPSSTFFIGGADLWSGFVNANVAILGDFKNNFVGCAVSSGVGSLLEMLADVGKLASGVGDLLQGVSTISSAGHAIQIVTEMEATDSPVDTAYITLVNNSVAGSASIAITPSNPSVGAGGQQLFSFTARDSLGNPIPNAGVVWSSSDTTIATIDNHGLASGVAAGQTKISVTAIGSGASASTLLNVTAPVLDHLELSPASSTLHIGQTAQFSVLGISSTGKPIALGPVTWTSSATNIVSVSQTGVITALQNGSAFINADSGGKSVAAPIGVIAATPSQIIVTPANATINVGNSFPLSATAVDSLGNPISGVPFTWSTNSAASATVDATGKVQGVAAGQATISANSGTLSGSASITVLVAGSQLSLSGTATCANGLAQVQLQWNNINAGSYDLYRENALLVPNILATTLTESGDLSPSTTYDYFLKAHMPGGGLANSNIATVAVPATCPGAAGTINVFPKTFAPVFTVGDAPATLGFEISNVGAGVLNGTIVAKPLGGSWLTVNGQVSSNWVAPEGVSVTADPAGLAPGTYTGSLEVSSTGATNSPLSIPVQMTIFAPLQITTSSLPVAFSNHPYSATLNATGGSGAGFVWSLQSGTLPAGLSLDPATGMISGTPATLTGSTVSTVNIGLQDSAGHFTFKTFSITWQESLAVLPISPSNFQFIVGTPYAVGNSVTFQAAGGTPPYSWTATGLPPGLALDGTSGLITGTPTQPGTFSASITVTDSAALSSTTTAPLTVVTTPLSIVQAGRTGPPNLPTATIGTAYSQVINAIGGSQSGYTWQVVGALPPGLTSGNSLGCPSTCGLLISGTPTQAGVFTFTAIVTDSLNSSTQQSVSIAVNSGTPPQIANSPQPLAVIGQPFSSVLSATGGTPPYRWSLIGTGPDPGLKLSSTGDLSGTPTLPNDCPGGPALWLSLAPSTYFQAVVTDVLGQSSVLQICQPSYFPDPQITSLTPASVTVDGQPHTVTVNGSNFIDSATLTLPGGGAVPTSFVSNAALNFNLAPSVNGSFDPGTGGVLNEGNTSITVIEPYTHASNPGTLAIFDPPPAITSVTAVLNNTNNPCTANLNCQLIINGSGLVIPTTYQIVETGATLILAKHPPTPEPWSSIMTSAFAVTVPGTYTITVTNPNQAAGGSAAVQATFTVGP